jgi:hypothetical protein
MPIRFWQVVRSGLKKAASKWEQTGLEWCMFVSCNAYQTHLADELVFTL